MPKKRKIQNWLNYSVGKYPVSKEPSKTIPGESVTIKEILEKHVAGYSTQHLERNAEYDEDPHIDDDIRMREPDFDLTDITEAKENLEEVKEAIEENQKKVKNETEEASKKSVKKTTEEVPPEQEDQESVKNETK